ncbi:MAG: AbrB/MazE/SpoVT family DNA-binding domain-containing protein [Chloroflexi bacterium]|nr:AbrB/MazE/SpoVT family DNA-binding domain-containing protein [Chloroflexota bacterium]
MPLARVLARGQVTLPRDVRRGAQIKPGDILNIEVVGPGRLRFTVLPRLSPRDLRDRYPIERPIDEAADREAWQAFAAVAALKG